MRWPLHCQRDADLVLKVAVGERALTLPGQSRDGKAAWQAGRPGQVQPLRPRRRDGMLSRGGAGQVSAAERPGLCWICDNIARPRGSVIFLSLSQTRPKVLFRVGCLIWAVAKRQV